MHVKVLDMKMSSANILLKIGCLKSIKNPSKYLKGFFTINVISSDLSYSRFFPF